MNDSSLPPNLRPDFIPCGPQETKSFYTGAYATEGAQLTGLTPDSGLISMGQMPAELRGTVPEHYQPALRPIAAAFSYTAITGAAHQVDVSLVGRKLPNFPGGGQQFWRHIICIHALDPGNLVRCVFGFNIPIPVDTEAGNGNPFSIRIITIGKTGLSIATVNWQWGLLNMSTRTHVGASG